MNKSIIYIFLVVFSIFFLIGCSSNTSINTLNENDGDPILGDLQFETMSEGSMDMGKAHLELTPISVLDGKLELKMVLDTHSVDFSNLDLKEITTLEFNGKKFKPISAPQLKGHHIYGVILFDVDTIPNQFIVKVNDIPGVEKGVFEWNIEK